LFWKQKKIIAHFQGWHENHQFATLAPIPALKGALSGTKWQNITAP
jgi:hypothetical protein